MKILIGEDDILIAEHIKDILKSYGYENVEMAHDKEKIIKLIDDYKPDIALLDIRMKGKYDGIEIGEYILQKYSFPIIFITSHSNQEVVKQALKTSPSAYIVKPFKPIDIFSALQIAIENYQKKEADSVFVFKQNTETIRIPYKEIMLLISDNNYVEIITETNKYVQRISLSELHKKLKSEDLVRVHRSYIVNIKFIDKIYSDKLEIKNYSIPVSRKYKESLKDLYS